MTNDKRLIVLLDNAEDGQYLDRISLGSHEHPLRSALRQSEAIHCERAAQPITEKDVASAITQYRALKAGRRRTNTILGEPELNRLGYQLLSMKKTVLRLSRFSN
jgi:hypothetical protein